MFDVNVNSLNRDVYIALHICNMNDVYNMYKKSIVLLDFVWRYFLWCGESIV